MARIDQFLTALAQSRMEALLLKPGQRPRFVQGRTHREVSNTSLAPEVIERALQEVAPDGPTAEGRWRFDYRVGEETFRFEATRHDDGWHARATLAAAGEGAPTGEEAEREPAAAGEPRPAESPPEPAAAAAQEAAPASPTGAAEPLPPVPELLATMVERDASDMHLSSEQPVMMRLDGELAALEEYEPPTAEILEERLFAIAPEASREEYQTRHDTDFGYELPGQARFRVNYFAERRGISAAFRLIPTSIPSADDLGLPDALRRIKDLSKGLILVTGPTGSGKSTTLAAMLDLLNRARPDHIITIEDPIEFVHPSHRCLVHQRQVGLHTEGFAKALRAALREDPDVVMVGEMRDLETTAMAIQTAETGHLVFGTLHTTSATSTVDRLIDQYPPDQQEQIRLMLAESLKAVVSQNLLRRKGGGRVAAFEILLVTPAISNMIREGKTFQMLSAMQTGRRIGMRLLNDSLLSLVEADTVTPEEAYLKAADKDDLVNRFKSAGIEVERTDPMSVG